MATKKTRKYEIIKKKIHKKTQKKSKKNSKKKFHKSKCSPLVKKHKNRKPFSCYTDEQLMKMRDLWNARHPDAKIEDSDSKKIWKRLRENMEDVCNRESCWLKQNFIKNNLSKILNQYTFAPRSPEVWKKNPTEWLSSIDIANVMKQYELAYPSFEFLGPSPIDFDSHMTGDKGEKPHCVWKELCEFKLTDYMKKGKKKIGVIFNLDPHYMPGSHWVALYIDVKAKNIFYFDSNGDPIPKEVFRLVEKVRKQGLKQKIKFTFDSNRGVEHQLHNTECGIYCLYFLIQLVKEKKKTEYFKKHLVRDNVMQKLRKIYFNIY